MQIRLIAVAAALACAGVANAGVKGATVTPAFSRSTSSVGNQDVNALRVRFNYAF